MNDTPEIRAKLTALLVRSQAILFDLDGTLIAVDKTATSRVLGKTRFLNPVFSPACQERLFKRFLTLAETPSNYLLALMERLGLNTDTGFGADRFRHLKGLGTSSSSALVAHAKDVLDWAQQEHRLAVVTARSRRAADHFLVQHSLTSYFEVITTRQDTWLLKPNPAPIKRTAQQLGLAPQACLMIGDTPMDMRAAKRAGAMALGVLSGLGSETELKKAGADLTIAEIGDLLYLVSSV